VVIRVDSADRRRVFVLALAAWCAGCQFDTRPILQERYGAGAPTVPVPMMQPEIATGPDFGNPGPSIGVPLAGSGAAGAQAPAPVPPISDPQPPSVPLLDAGTAGSGPSFMPADAAASPPNAADAAAELPDAADAQQPSLPEPGAPFSACSDDADCEPDLPCVKPTAWADANARGYCTAFCGSGTTPAEACPQPSSGLVAASCQFGWCVLGSCERAQCPMGLQCEVIEMGTSPGQFVDVFACQP
jgi:hypothetical protein